MPDCERPLRAGLAVLAVLAVLAATVGVEATVTVAGAVRRVVGWVLGALYGIIVRA